MSTIDPPAADRAAGRPTRPTVADLGNAASDAIRVHFDHLFRTLFCPPGSLLAPNCMRYITDSPHPLGNAAFFSRDASPDEVSRVVEPLATLPLPSAVILMNDDRPEQTRAVESRGYTFAEPMPLMSVTPETLAPTTLPEGYTYREIPLDEDAAWSEAVSTGYGLPLELGSQFGPRRAGETCPPGVARHFAVEHAGDLVATSLLYLHDGLAGIYGVATKPEHRGKGLAAHLTAEPLRAAWNEGYNTGLLQASAMGAPVYTRIGFHTHASMALLVRVPQTA